MKPNKKRGQKYVCTAQHTSFDHPTGKAKTWYKSVKEIAEDDLELVEQNNRDTELAGNNVPDNEKKQTLHKV